MPSLSSSTLHDLDMSSHGEAESSCHNPKLPQNLGLAATVEVPSETMASHPTSQ